MKSLKFLLVIVVVSAVMVGCEKDSIYVESNEMEGLYKINDFDLNDHQVQIYSDKEKLEVGYNDIYIRVLDKATDGYIGDADISWMPMMKMPEMSHGAPHSDLTNKQRADIYYGYIVFQMAEDEMSHWELTLNYKFHGEPKSMTEKIRVAKPVDGLRKVQSFTGSDEESYVLAMKQPRKPKEGNNMFEAVLYKMAAMHSFQSVEEYKISVDPRMPSMGNHSSPNNEDLVYNPRSNTYKGTLSFTMTGFWRINMIVKNKEGDVIKGEPVTEQHPESSLYFEIEF